MTSDELRFVMEKIIRLVSVQFCVLFFLVYLRLLMLCEESGLDITFNSRATVTLER